MVCLSTYAWAPYCRNRLWADQGCIMHALVIGVSTLLPVLFVRSWSHSLSFDWEVLVVESEMLYSRT